MKRILKLGIITLLSIPLLLCCLGVLHFYVTGPYFEKFDDQANQKFADKARQFQIKGKPEEYVLKHFGEPHYRYITPEGDEEILVYIPGPALALWPSECKIGVDINAKLVTGWMINSD